MTSSIAKRQSSLSALGWLVTAVGMLAGIARIVAHTRITDFPVDMTIYREGVQAFLDGRPVYSEPMLAGDIALPFIYPPFGALAMVPLASRGISHDTAGNIMIVLSDLLLVACLYFCFRAVLAPRHRRLLLPITSVTWAVALFFEPIDLNNSFAQINVVIMALVVFDLVPRKRWLPQGWLIGLAAAIKITPLAMLLYPLLKKDVRTILTAAASAIIATAVAAAVRWDAFVDFFTVKLLAMGTGDDFGVGTDYQSNSSIKGVVQRLYPSLESATDHATLTSVVWLALTLITIAAGAWAMRLFMRRDLNVEAWLIGSLVMLLISPVSWSHHWVWLALVVPVFAYRAWIYRHSTWVSGALLATLATWTVLMVTVPPKWWFGDQIDVYGMPLEFKLVVDDYVWFALLTAVLFVIVVRRRLPMPTPTPPTPKTRESRAAATDRAASSSKELQA